MSLLCVVSIASYEVTWYFLQEGYPGGICHCLPPDRTWHNAQWPEGWL